MPRLPSLQCRALLLLLATALLPAYAQQSPAPVKHAVEEWLVAQTKGLPGRVAIEVGGLDPGNQLAPCRAFDISRPPGARLWGRTHIIVRCLDEPAWRVFISVQIRVKAPYLITARPLMQGQLIAADDLATQIGDLSELPGNVVTEPSVAVGMIASSGIPAGRPLRADLLRPQTAIRQGQTVKVISQGAGFNVANEGKALNNAVAGQVAQVRLGNGQIVSGIAQSSGTVEVSF